MDEKRSESDRGATSESEIEAPSSKLPNDDAVLSQDTSPDSYKEISPSIIGLGGGGGKAPIQRLSDKTEKLAYIFVLLVGGAIILFGKIGGWLGPWPAAHFAIVSITAYAFFAWTSQKENPVRADRLGDNCYYLGLVYTLASLIASLIIIDRGADVNALLGNFGVALVSTAAGIVARLLLIQFKSETDDVDQRARITLAETAQGMQADLLAASSVFRSLMIEAQESFRISVDRTRNNLEQAEEVVSRVQSLDISPDKLNESLFGVISNIEKASTSISGASDTFQRHTQALEGTANSVLKAETSMANIQATLEQVANTLERQRAATEQVISAMVMQSERAEQHSRKLEINAEEARLATEKVYKSLGDLASTIVGRLK